MFEFGFWEIIVIAVVALFVIGPERLPAVARTLGVWFGRMRGYMNSVQADFKHEIAKADELRRMAESESKIAELHERMMKEVVDGRVPRSAQQSAVAEEKPEVLPVTEQPAVQTEKDGLPSK